MRPSLRHGLLAAWALWTLWVVVHYFTIPAPVPDAPAAARYHDFVDLFDRALAPAVFWREALARAVWGVGGALAVLLAGWGLGGLVMAPFDAIVSGRGERILVRFALGLAILSSVCLALALLQIYRPVTVTAVLGVAAVVGAWAVLRGGVRTVASANAWPWVWRELRGADALFVICAAAGLAFAFVGALAPETEYDALWYHLWLPHEWLNAGRPVDRVDEYISLYPLHWELLYGAAMSVGGPVAAKLLHFSCLPLTAAATALMVRRVFAGASAWLAAALTICTPILLWEATTAYIDLALAWYLALAAYAAFRFYDTPDLKVGRTYDRRWLFLCAVFVGIAMSIKHLGLVALAIAALLLAGGEFSRYRNVRRAFTTAFAVCAVALLPALPWYARAFVRSGNPVFPDFYSVFGAKPPDRWSPESAQALRAFKDHFGRERTPASLATVPWDATVHAERYGGTLGPLFLVLVPFAAATTARARRRALMIVLACALYVAVWASPISSFQMRFLVPLVPLLAVLASLGVAEVRRAASSAHPSGALVVTVLLACLVAANLPPFIRWHEPDRVGWNGWLTHVMRWMPAPVVLGAESEASYLGRNVRSYNAWTFIDGHLPADARVLAFSGGDHLYATRSRLSADSTMARTMTWGSAAGQESAVLRAAARLHMTHVLIDKRTNVSALAIGSDRMRRCCLETVYDDAEMTLYRLKLETTPPDGREGTDAARSSTP